MTNAMNMPDECDSPQQPVQELDRLDTTLPVAVLFIGGEYDLGSSLLHQFGSVHARDCRQILFVSIGVMDYAVLDSGVDASQGFKGTEEAERLRRKARLNLDPYVATAREMGMKVDARVSVATNAVDEIDRLADEIMGTYPRASYFVAKLAFHKKKWFHRFLHAGTADAIRKRLEKKGLPVMVVSVVLPT